MKACAEQLSPFGRLFPLIRIYRYDRFSEDLSLCFTPSHDPQAGTLSDDGGHFDATVIGLNRIWHFISLGSMPCSVVLFKLDPAASGHYLLGAMWTVRGSGPTPVLKDSASYATVSGNCATFDMPGSRLTSTPRSKPSTDRCKARARYTMPAPRQAGPAAAVAFIEETHQYLVGKLRKGTTVSPRGRCGYYLVQPCARLCFRKCSSAPTVSFYARKAYGPSDGGRLRLYHRPMGAVSRFSIPTGFVSTFKRRRIDLTAAIYGPSGCGCACRFVGHAHCQKQRIRFKPTPTGACCFGTTTLVASCLLHVPGRLGSAR